MTKGKFKFLLLVYKYVHILDETFCKLVAVLQRYNAYVIFQIYHGLIFFHGVSKDDFDARWKSFQFIKDALANKLTRNKQHIRSLLIERTVLHQESRILENSVSHLTPTHSAIMNSLLQLSTSQYSEVSNIIKGHFCCIE